MSEEGSETPKPASSLIGRKREVEHELGELQANHRLAIHCFEESGGRTLYPSRTIKLFQSVVASHIPEALRTLEKFPIFSMSLLPSPESGKTIIPYGSGTPPAYLFDLSGDAKVVRAFPENGMTGDSVYNKSLYMGDKTGIKDLDDIYGQYQTAAGFKKAVANDDTLSGKQLDALGQYYASPASQAKSISQWNEVLVAASNEHIKAIAVSVYNNNESRNQFVELFAQLKGALVGLAHANHGIIKPVVCYNIGPPNQGKCTYLAEGKDECEAVAKDAIRKLQEQPGFESILSRSDDDTTWLKAETQRLLKIDISVPLPPQGITTGK